MVEEKPTTAFVLSLIAGIFIVIGALVFMSIGAIFSWVPVAGLAVFLYGLVGLLWGVLVLIGAFMMYSKPDQAKTGGVMVLIFSILSIFGAAAGLVIGFILGIIGGALGIAWSPKKRVEEEEKRTCLNCGRLYPVKYTHCPYCGAAPGEKKEESE